MTSITEIFKDSLVYPTTDWMKLIILGVLYILTSLVMICGSFKIDTSGALGTIFGIISLIVGIIIYGYEISVIKSGCENSNSIPDLDIAKNFINGIKFIILTIVYYIIPAVIIIICGFATGAFNAIFNVLAFMGQNPGTSVNNIPVEYLTSLFTSLSLTVVIAIILAILFGLLMTIGMARLAKYDSLSEGFSFGKIIKDIGQIGWGSYIAWYIVYFILTIIILIVAGIIFSFIPYIGVILTPLLLMPYLTLFAARAIGLLYSKVE